MEHRLTRRRWLGVLGGGAATAALAADTESAAKRLILGIACSPRPGKTTAAAVQRALQAAVETNPNFRTELIDLGGRQLNGWNGSGLPKDDFASIRPRLADPSVAGLIIGSPVYFRCMSALCKAFLEQCGSLRKPDMLLRGKPVGVLAVGAYRNGGQELVIAQIQAALLCHEAVIVGGRAPAFQGATLVNDGSDDLAADPVGMEAAAKLGQRVAEAV